MDLDCLEDLLPDDELSCFDLVGDSVVANPNSSTFTPWIVFPMIGDFCAGSGEKPKSSSIGFEVVELRDRMLLCRFPLLFACNGKPNSSWVDEWSDWTEFVRETRLG